MDGSGALRSSACPAATRVGWLADWLAGELARLLPTVFCKILVRAVAAAAAAAEEEEGDICTHAAAVSAAQSALPLVLEGSRERASTNGFRKQILLSA
jgi:hypothetical protein